MTAPFHGISRRTLAVLAGFGVVLLAGCGGGAGEPEAETETTEEVVEYTVRGRIVDVPDPERPASELMVRHEAIPSFRTAEGVTGMRSMTMPFPLAGGVSLDELEPGDVVSLRFQVRHESGTWRTLGYEVIEITELPPDTELILGETPAESEGPDKSDQEG